MPAVETNPFDWLVLFFAILSVIRIMMLAEELTRVDSILAAISFAMALYLLASLGSLL